MTYMCMLKMITSAITKRLTFKKLCQNVGLICYNFHLSRRNQYRDLGSGGVGC